MRAPSSFMAHMRKTILLLTTAAGLAVVPAAQAADRTGTVGASSPSYAWDGGPGTAYSANIPGLGGIGTGFFGCRDGIADCDETLIKVDVAGKLTVTANADDDSTDAIDLYLYPSDAEGTYDDSDDDLAEAAGATEASDETVAVSVNPGFYIAQVRFFDASDDTFKGTATLSGFAAPEPAATPTVEAPAPPPPAAQPAPAQQSQPAEQSKPTAKQKLAAKKKKCQKKAKKIKNKKKRKKALKKCAKLKK